MSRIILLIVVLMLGAGLVACEEEEEPAPSAEDGESGAAAIEQETASANATAAIEQESPTTDGAAAAIGDMVEVGDLDLVVLSAEPTDTTQYNQFNDANYRLQIRATNARGGEDSTYEITTFAFQLVDDSGVAHDPAFACAGCPDDLGGGVSLTRGGTFEGNVYFALPEGRTPVELRYEPVFSTNQARISLQQ